MGGRSNPIDVRRIRDEVEQLETACRGFDEQTMSPNVCTNIASASLRKLLKDGTRNAVAVLTHLKLKQSMTFFDGAIPPLGGISSMAHCGLAGFSASRHVPNLDSILSDVAERPMRGFDTWWSSPVIWDNQGRTFSRSDIVLVAADKDGGAHLDASLPSEYYDLVVDNSLGRIVGFGDKWAGLGSPIPACVRHISHEVLVSIATHAPYSFRSKHHAHALRTGKLKARLNPSDGLVIRGMAVHGHPVEDSGTGAADDSE